MRISQLAARTGVPATTLRFYETMGLLPADRNSSGYRVYGEPAVERLAFIRAAKQVGLPLEQVAELLTVRERGACRDVRSQLRPMMAARLEEVNARIAELRIVADMLQDIMDQFDALPDRPTPCDPQCAFLQNSTSHPMSRGQHCADQSHPPAPDVGRRSTSERISLQPRHTATTDFVARETESGLRPLDVGRDSSCVQLSPRGANSTRLRSI